MYICKECGKEYEEKPDYCDCGNDEFDISAPEKIKQADINKETPSEQPKTEKTVVREEKIKPQPAPSYKTFNNIPKKKTFKEQYPALSRFFSSIELVSAVFFCICLITAFYILFYAWNPEENDLKIQEKQETVSSKTIPSIDKFWNNTPPAPKPQAANTQKTEQKEVQPVQVQTKPAEKKTVTIPLVNNTVKKNETKTAQTKVSQPKSTQNKTKQTVTTQKQKTDKAAQEAAKKKAAEEAAKQKAAQDAQAKKLAEEQARLAAQKKAEQEAQAKKAAEEAAKQKAAKSAAEKQELANYKANLRNAIGRKIDFTKVIGDGSCTVAFKINSSGKLVSRSFAQQSSNMTLNDAVYAAVMATPTFNPPPSGYRDETLKLYIRFYNGNFEISLP